MRSLTNLFRRVNTTQTIVDRTVRIHSIRGIGVLMTRMRIDDTTPIRQSATRSPRKAASGGAMLSALKPGKVSLAK